MTDDTKNSGNPFPIRELSARTQVNTVTLRAWERRYGLLNPERTTKGHRLYSNEDVATIEKILSLVARGVPIGKVKPLLQNDEPVIPDANEAENWQSSVAEFVVAVESFTASKVEHLIHESFAQYPVPICREHLLEPAFAILAEHGGSGAAFRFAESELIRYATLRLNAKVAKKKRSALVTLIAGDQSPLWRLSLMALELHDAEFMVQLLHSSFSVAAAIEISEKLKDGRIVFYQDGVWKDKEQKTVDAVLRNNDRLFMCGTAPMLSPLDNQERVFTDVKSCTDVLLQQQLP